ncbi:MAG: signal peptidase II [Bdellovibrionaceae bacterium]|nr:signal peptidase II [Pseudobdellovibrionaceae bacterium]
MNKKYLILLAIAGLIVSIDQATKLYVHSHFNLGESIVVIKNWFNLTYVRNPGAAFGFLSTSPEAFRDIFFLSIPPLALIFILYILKDVASNDNIQIVALSGIFGGAIGNYIDRLRFRYVIDFLDFHIYNKYTWPAFNVADSAIVGGIAVLFLIMFRKDRSKNPEVTN